MKNMLIMAIGWIIFQICFAFAGSFFNYGYDYITYISQASLWIILAFTLFVIVLSTDKFAERLNNFLIRKRIWFGLLLSTISGFIFWLYRTRVHLFLGDECIGPIQKGQYTIGIPERIDWLVRGTIHWFAIEWADLTKLDVLPSIYGCQVASVACGIFAIIIAVLFLRRRPLLMLFFITMPWLINFFGNVDNYAFSVCYAIFFSCIVGLILEKNRIPKIWEVLTICLLWVIGIWTNPFHVFFVFVPVYLGCLWLEQWWKKIPIKTVLFLTGVLLFITLKCSSHSNLLFETNKNLVPAFFSWQTLIHYANNLLLPMIPFACVVLFSSSHKWARGFLIISWIMISICFFTLSFTLGACDLFNYMQLLCIVAGYGIMICMRTPLKSKEYIVLIALNLFLLIPMIYVHSSNLTISRALRIYPKDKCHHNMVMSWQTHLGIICGENVQYSTEIEKATLSIFFDGFKSATPEYFKCGNYVYFVAWHYHYGKIEQGRKLLKNLLQQYPQIVKMLLSDRPGFILHNREILLDDLVNFYPADDNVKNQLRIITNQIKKKILEDPYQLTTSNNDQKK